MAQFNLDPALGEECAAILKSQMNGDILDSIIEAYNAMVVTGENTVTNAYLAKFGKIEQEYNDNILPALDAINKNFGEYTELAYMMHTKQVDETIASTPIDPIADSGFAEGFSI